MLAAMLRRPDAHLPVSLDVLAADRDVIAAAHPGFSNSEGLDLLDHLGLAQVDVVGLSLGGWLAAELAKRNRGRVRRLILVDAAGVYLPGFDQFEFFQDPISNPGFPAEMRRRCFHDSNSEIARSFIPDQILILWGESDCLRPLDFARAYQELIPGAELKVMEKCGHMPPIERPQEFAKVVGGGS